MIVLNEAENGSVNSRQYKQMSNVAANLFLQEDHNTAYLMRWRFARNPSRPGKTDCQFTDHCCWN